METGVPKLKSCVQHIVSHTHVLCKEVSKKTSKAHKDHAGIVTMRIERSTLMCA